MNITNRLVFQKSDPIEDDPDYLNKVRQEPCVICQAFGEVQMSPTTAHHPIHGRYSTRKAPDRNAIPLCEGHHQGLRDTSKTAIHNGKETWAAKYGYDYEYIAVTQDRILT